MKALGLAVVIVLLVGAAVIAYAVATGLDAAIDRRCATR